MKSVSQKVTTLSMILLIGFSLVFLFNPIKEADALAYPIAAPVIVNTATASQNWPVPSMGSCTYANFFYVFWLDSSNVVWVSSSSDGAKWSTPANILTLTSLGTGTATSTSITQVPFKMACNGNAVTIVWTTVNAGSSASTLTNYMYYSIGFMLNGGVTMQAAVNGPKTANGFNMQNKFAGVFVFGCVNVILGTVFYCVSQVVTTGAQSIVENNLDLANVSYAGLLTMAYQGNTFMLWNAHTCDYAVSGDAVTWPASQSLISSSVCQTAASNNDGYYPATFNGLFYLSTSRTSITSSYIVVINNAGTVVATQIWQSTQPLTSAEVTVDANGNFLVLGCNAGMSLCGYATWTNSLGSMTAALSFSLTGATLGTGTISFWSFSMEPAYSATLESFAVETVSTSNPFNVYATVFGSPSTASGTNQVQTIGSCPTKNTGTFTMVNNTIYMYYGNALGSEVVNTVQTSVASITGSGSHTLKMLVYVSSGQSANVATPLLLAYQQSIVISSGTTNDVITFQVNIPLNTAVANPLPFNLWGVGIVGDNKIKLNQSSLSGLFIQTGSASTANQPASFTSQGTSVGTMLYLCATASYQSVLPAVTTTTTQAATTTSTAFTTSTATISTIGATLFTTSSNWPVIFLILLLPAGLFLGVTKTIAGAILGLVVGSVIGELMGILPTFVFVGLVISLIAVAFVARNREGG